MARTTGDVISQFRVAEGRFELTVLVVQMGQDVVVCLFGGDKPHIGSVALAVPRPSLRDPTQQSATASVLNVVGHKEDQLTKSAAEQLSAGLGQVVSVVAGVHYNALDKDGVEAICRLGEVAVKQILALYQERKASCSS